MVDEPTEKEIADLAEKFGLSRTQPEPLKGTLFQGDFGTSINFSDLLITLILFLAVIFLIVYTKKKKKKSE